jgi:hypothetical protein
VVLRSAVIGLELLGHAKRLRSAIRQLLAAAGGEPVKGVAGRSKPQRTRSKTSLRKLLRLHYPDQITAEQFAEEQARLTSQIDALRADRTAEVEQRRPADEIAEGFEQSPPTSPRSTFQSFGRRPPRTSGACLSTSCSTESEPTTTT